MEQPRNLDDQPLFRLRRFLRPTPPAYSAGEVCEFCAASVQGVHSHVADLRGRTLLCVCRACYLLFTNPGAGGGRYRAVPERYVYVAALALSDEQWIEFQIPVGVAFFFYNSSQNRTLTFYPSPAGATESTVPIEVWKNLLDDNPILRSLQPDVEALLVSRLPGRCGAFIIPIDACYELVGRIRQEWRGFNGGEQAWFEIDAFFSAVRHKTI